MGVSKAVRYRVTYKLTPEQIAVQRAEDDATEAVCRKLTSSRSRLFNQH